MKKSICALLALTLLLSLAACKKDAFVFTEENMPRIDGSTATIPLIEAVHAVLLGVPREQAADLFEVTGTDNAYMALINGSADLLLVYAPAQSSTEYAEAQGVELEMAPIGKDGLVFLVNKQNPVSDLSTRQLADIYSGAVNNWNEVGGADAVIAAYQRQLRSGSQTMMDALVMKGTKMREPEPGYVISEMGGLVEAVANYENSSAAIGYNVYYFVSRMKLDENIKLLSVDGVAPTTESIGSGEYPFVSDFYAVIRKTAAEGSPERVLFEWIQSKDGQTLVKGEGYATTPAN